MLPRTEGMTTATSLTALRLRRNGWRGRSLLAGTAALCLLAVFGIFIGSRSIPAEVTWQALFAFDEGNAEHLLIRHLRIPRALLAILVGCALSTAGVIMQALTRNPLADPGILGVNAGATLAIVAAIAFWGITDIATYMWFGLLGAGLSGTGIYLLSTLNGGMSPIRLVLAGSALSVVLLALTQIITVNSDEQIFDQFRHWAVGSLQGRGYDVLLPVFLWVAAGLGLTLWLTKALDTIALGHDLSQSLGISPQLTWILSVSVIVILAGAATAAAGPITFIGLTAPHIARFLVGSDHRWLIPFSMLIAAMLMTAADILGRWIGAPGEISVGIMVGLMGGLFFIVLVHQRRSI